MISRSLDVIWSFPVILLGVALGTALALAGFSSGRSTIGGDSLLIPMLIIGVRVRAVHGAARSAARCSSLREKEFVEAARAQGAGPAADHVLRDPAEPRRRRSIVFFPLLVANAILLEAALSFLGAGVQAPEPSWGTMIDDGVERIATGPHLTIVPGLMLVLTVLALNVFGDGVRDALRPARQGPAGALTMARFIVRRLDRDGPRAVRRLGRSRS